MSTRWSDRTEALLQRAERELWCRCGIKDSTNSIQDLISIVAQLIRDIDREKISEGRRHHENLASNSDLLS